MESDRENNLNTRATALAAAAGVILALAAPVAKTIFREVTNPWSSDIAVASFVLALLGVAFAMLVAVWKILRPRGPRHVGRKALAGDLSGLWADHDPHGAYAASTDRRAFPSRPRSGTDLARLAAETDRVRFYALDRSLEALASWWTRNLDKQNALRYSYVLFAVSVVCFVATGGALLYDEVREPATASVESSSGSSDTKVEVKIVVSWWVVAFFALGVLLYVGGWALVRAENSEGPDVERIEQALEARAERPVVDVFE